MNAFSLSRRISVAGLASLMMLPFAQSAQAAEQDFWAMVPAWPTTCYQETEDFPDKYRAALEAVTAAKDRQQKINDELAQKVKDMDPMEQASKMQEYMMANPEEAMKLMQRNAAIGETFTNSELESNEGGVQLEKEMMDLDTRYKAEVEKALAPIKAKFADLDARAQKDLVVVGEGYAYAPWAVKEFDALTAESNKAYEKVCAGWWGANGIFQEWMKRLKESLVARIPEREEAEKVGAGLLAVVAGTPGNSFKPIAAPDAVMQYTQRGIRLFENRMRRPEAPYTR